MMSRRNFFEASGTAAALAGSAAAQPSSSRPVRLGFDAYSLRAWRWTALELIDYAARQKVDTVQMPLGDLESTEPAHVAKVRDTAAAAGIRIDAAIGCVCPSTKSWTTRNGTPREYITHSLPIAKALGSSSMRVFMGSNADRRPDPIEKHIEAMAGVLRSVRSEVLDSGLRIAVENHGDMQARELKALIEEAGQDMVGACLDTGNPMWCLEDPLLTLEVLGPYAVTTHVRDSVVYERPDGAAAQWVALGDGVIDFPRFMARFREICPGCSVQLENITGRPPTVLAYLEPDFWKAFPHMPAGDFARFLAIVKKGRPFSGAMVIADVGGKVPPEYTAALKEQQRVDLERGLDYARKTLKLGLHASA